MKEKKIVVIGGGTGLSVLLRGLKHSLYQLRRLLLLLMMAGALVDCVRSLISRRQGMFAMF